MLTLQKKNLPHNFFICGTCSDVDRLKLPLKVCQKCVSVRGIFQMTNDIVIKKNGTQLFLFWPRVTYENSWGLESSKKDLSPISGLHR